MVLGKKNEVIERILQASSQELDSMLCASDGESRAKFATRSPS